MNHYSPSCEGTGREFLLSLRRSPRERVERVDKAGLLIMVEMNIFECLLFSVQRVAVPSRDGAGTGFGGRWEDVDDAEASP